MRTSNLRSAVRRVTAQYYAIALVFSLGISFFFATYSVFLRSRGLSLMQINLVNCFFMAGVFLLEIPTGAYADILGRKRSFVWSCFVTAGSLVAYFFARSFWACVGAELLAAIGLALYSGALEAWLVDSLRHCGMRGDLKNVFAAERRFGEAGTICGSLAGGYIASYDIALPWLCGAVCMCMLGVFSALSMREDYFDSPGTNAREAMGTVIADSVRYGFGRREVAFVIAFGTVVSCCCQALNMQWQLRFADGFGFSPERLGWVFVAISLAIMSGGQLAARFCRIFGNPAHAIVCSQAVTASGILAAGYCSGIGPVMCGFLVHETGRGIMEPLKKSYINRAIPSRQRATVLSFESMILRTGSFVGLAGSGFLADRYSISAAWTASSLLLFCAIPVFLWMARRR